MSVTSLNKYQKSYVIKFYTSKKHTIAEIAKLFRTSRGTVYNVLEEAGIDLHASPASIIQLMNKYLITVSQLERLIQSEYAKE